MKTRHIYRIMFVMAALLLANTACVEPVQQVSQPETGILYPISFRVQTQDNGLLTKVGGPLSGEDALVSSLFMYCFDSNGRYLGRYQATILTQEPYYPTANPAQLYTETQTPGTFKGEIPPATARIHFVANADCPVGGDYIGMTEQEVMNSPGLVYRTTGDDMSYWGYLRRSTSNQIKDLFDEDITDQTVTIWMIRDRAWIEAGSYKKKTATSTPGDGSFYDDISWVVYNGLNNGYIATFGTTPADGTNHIKPWLDEDNPYQELSHGMDPFTVSSEVTAYPESGGRFTRTEQDMVPFDKTKTTGDNPYQPMFVFDDKCVYTTSSDFVKVTKIIIRATFNVTGNSETDHREHTKFFPLCISHGFDAEPIPIQRGHRYQLSLQTLPEAAGYDDFAGAVAASTFANGALVDIPQSVIEVSDGAFNMRVNYTLTYPLSRETFASTAVLIQNTTSQVKVPFEVKKEGVSDREFDFSESAWLDAEEGTTPAYSSKNVSWTGLDTDQHAKVGTGSGYVNPLNSSVTFNLASVEEDQLKESVYNLKGFYTTKETVVDQATGVSAQYDVKHILMRNIDVYSIDRFRIQDVYTSASTETEVHNDAHNLALVSLGDSKYRLKFTLPGGTNTTGDHDKYPDVLYPLQVKLATRTLQPTDVYINGIKQNNAVFGVQVLTTVPDTPPAMLTEQNQTNQWNYQSSSSYWNFWYSYPIVSVPRYNGMAGEIKTGTSGEEIEGPEIWIDLMDVRNPSVFQTIPENVGLYLYIEFFGAANAVSFDKEFKVIPVEEIIVHREGQTENETTTDNRYSIRRSTNGGGPGGGGQAYTSTLQLIASVNPDNASYKAVTWKSSNNARATVDANGLVTITTAGTGTGGGPGGGQQAGTEVSITATSVKYPSISNTFYLTVTNN